MFSGIGGFDKSLVDNGHECVGACEIDKYAASIYAKQFPGVPIHKDATKINTEELPHIDCIVAGFPCQTFSITGKRGGFNDTRGTLFFEITRITKRKKPSVLLLENVTGLQSHDEGRTFKTILRTIDEIGYDAEWTVFNSKYFVPQDRKRIYIVGRLREESESEILFVRSNTKKNPDTRSKSKTHKQKELQKARDIFIEQMDIE